MAEQPTLGVYLACDDELEHMGDLLEAWFANIETFPEAASVPAHVVAWELHDGDLRARARAALARSVYDAGAMEAWLIEEGREVLLPRLIVGGANEHEQLTLASGD